MALYTLEVLNIPNTSNAFLLKASASPDVVSKSKKTSQSSPKVGGEAEDPADVTLVCDDDDRRWTVVTSHLISR